MYYAQNITARKSAASARYPQPLHVTYCCAMHGCVYEREREREREKKRERERERVY
jgi:hypothetical protein